ncbi:hypothetical protein [Bradyrhizobium sp.]|uniref:hypothetical protein n=1 Tax=Bradyrhizobium sp. TaxID=376 RepID=UPI001EB782CA|nr:hypothetical protein [Bradyrhizobium sp.]MBV9984490.1 hypothetical protein [Bradyrhizobium sp.]
MKHKFFKLAVLCAALALFPALAVAQGQFPPNTVSAGPPSGSNSGEPSPRLLVPADLPPGTTHGLVLIQPNVGQVNSAASPWLAVGPHGETIPCTPTTTQCINEALIYAQQNAYALEVNCVGTTSANAQPVPLTVTSTIVIPPQFMGFVEFRQCVVLSSASPIFLVDSQDSSTIILQVRPSTVLNGDAIHIAPTTSTGAVGKNVLNSTIYIESAASSGTGTGCLIDSTNGAITGNTIYCQDPNGGKFGILLNPVNVIEDNKIHFRYVHQHTTAGIAVNLSGAGACKRNTWYGGRIAPNGAVDGFLTACVNDTIVGASVMNEEGAVFNGFHLQPGASGNTFVGASVDGATVGFDVDPGANNNNFFGGHSNAPKADAGTGNVFNHVIGVLSADQFSNLPACGPTTHGLSIGVSDATVNTWGATISAGGSGNQVLAYCDGTNWTVAGK